MRGEGPQGRPPQAAVGRGPPPRGPRPKPGRSPGCPAGPIRTLHILKKCRRLRHSVGYAVLEAGAYSRRATGISSAPRALPSATASTTPTACQLKMRALTK